MLIDVAVLRLTMLILQLETVRCDFQALQSRFKSKYQASQSFVMANVRDIPPVSGMVLWINQIRSQVGTYLSKIHNILGKDWAKRPDGAVLKVPWGT